MKNTNVNGVAMNNGVNNNVNGGDVKMMNVLTNNNKVNEMMEEAMGNVITSREEFMNFEKIFMKMKRAYVPMLVVGKKSYFQMNPQSLGETLENAQQGGFEITCRNNFIVVEETDEVLAVYGYLKVFYKSNAMRREMHAKNNEVWINFKEGKAYIVKHNTKGQLMGIRDMIAGTYNQNVTKEEVDYMLTGAELWKGLNYSPSDIRTAKALWIKTEDGVDIRDEKLDELTDGAYSKAHGKEFDRAKITAAFGRSAQRNPASVNLGTIGNEEYGILWIKEEIVSELSTMNGLFKEKQSTWDGGSWLNAAPYAQMCTKRLRDVLEDDSITVAPEALYGSQPQIRFSLAKVSCEVDSQDIFARRAENFMRKYKYEIKGNPNNILVIVDNNGLKNFCKIYPELSNTSLRLLALDKATPANASKTQMLSKIVSFPGVRSLISERIAKEVLNEVMTLLPDKDAPASIVTKEEALGLEGYAADILSKIDRRLCYDPAILNSKAKNSVQKLTNMVDKLKFNIGGCFTRLWLDDTETLLSDEQIKVLENLNARGIIQDGYAFNAGFVRHYKAKLNEYRRENKAEIDERIEAINSDETIKDKKAAIRALNNAIEEEANISRKGWMIKYPAPGSKEVYCFTFLLPQDIKRIAKSFGFDRETTNLIINNLLNSKDSRLMLPAEDIIKYQEAGLDMDFDGGVCYWDEEFAKFFHQIERTIVKIVRPEEEQKEAPSSKASKYARMFDRTGNIPERTKSTYVVCADNGMSVGYDMQMDNDNMGVGPCTNIGYTFNACKTIEDKAFALNISLKSKGGKGKYVSPLKKTVIHLPGGDAVLYEVALKDSKEVEKRIKNADLGDAANLKAIYNDIDILFRMFQELLIDSAKKGDKVPVNFTIKKFKPLSLLQIQNNFKEFSKHLNDLKSNRASEDEDNEDSFFEMFREIGDIEVMNDEMSVMQDDAAEIVETAVNVNLKKIYAESEMTEDTVCELEETLVVYQEHVCDVDTSVRAMYRSCVGTYIARLAEIDEMANDLDPETITDLQDEAKEEHKANLAILDNLLNQIVRDIVEEKGLAVAGSIVKAASCLLNFYEDGNRYCEINPRGTNSMSHTLGYKYALARTLKEVGTTLTGYRLVSGTAKYVQEGEVLEFRNGRATASNGKMVLLSGSIASGTFTITEHEDAFYAVQDFSVDDIETPEIDDTQIAFRVRTSFDVKRVIAGDVVLHESAEATDRQRKYKQDALPMGDYKQMLHAIKDAKEIILLPMLNYEYEIDGTPYEMQINNAIVATFEDEQGEFLIPVGIYAVESKVLESIYNGVHGTVKRIMLNSTADEDFTSLMIVINKEGQEPEESYFDWKESKSNNNVSDEDIVEEYTSAPAKSEKTSNKAAKKGLKFSASEEEEILEETDNEEVLEEEILEEETMFDEEEIIEEE